MVHQMHYDEITYDEYDLIDENDELDTFEVEVLDDDDELLDLNEIDENDQIEK